MKKKRGEGEKVRKGKRRDDRQETEIDCEKQDGVFTLRDATREKWRHLRGKK